MEWSTEVVKCGGTRENCKCKNLKKSKNYRTQNTDSIISESSISIFSVVCAVLSVCLKIFQYPIKLYPSLLLLSHHWITVILVSSLSINKLHHERFGQLYTSHLLTVEIGDFDWAAVGVKEWKVAWTSAIQRAPNLSSLTTLTTMAFVTWLARAVVVIVLYLDDCRSTWSRTDPRWRWMYQLSQVVSQLIRWFDV